MKRGAQNPQTGFSEKYIDGFTSILTPCTCRENRCQRQRSPDWK